MQTTNEQIVFLVLSSSFIILILLVLSVTILFFYQKKQVAYQEKLNTLKTEFDKSLLNAQLEIQEQTFHHISREIHDNIGLSLTLAKLQLNTLSGLQYEQAQAKVVNSVELISTAIDDLRSLSKGLNGNMILKNGFVKALEEEAERVKKTGRLAIHLNIDGNIAYLDTEKELLLFRVVQESLNNIIRHSEATRAEIDLRYDERSLILQISDNGKGFNNDSELSKGSGLSNIEVRTRMMSGKSQIHSTPAGTTIQINIPI
jgi:signal transduction histidine kinase